MLQHIGDSFYQRSITIPATRPSAQTFNALKPRRMGQGQHWPSRLVATVAEQERECVWIGLKILRYLERCSFLAACSSCGSFDLLTAISPPNYEECIGANSAGRPVIGGDSSLPASAATDGWGCFRIYRPSSVRRFPDRKM